MARRYGIVYGAEGRSDYEVDGGYESVTEARSAYDRGRRVRYQDGVLGGAEVVELDSSGAPCRTVEVLAGDSCAGPHAPVADRIRLLRELCVERGMTWGDGTLASEATITAAAADPHSWDIDVEDLDTAIVDDGIDGAAAIVRLRQAWGLPVLR